jgi:hypothetical protein
MKKICAFQVAASAILLAFCALTQPAMAESATKFHIAAVPHTKQAALAPAAISVGLLPLLQAFVALPPSQNTDGTFLWPCLGNTTTPNPDCPTIGNPSIPFPTGGIVIGSPAALWSLASCTATTTTTPNCGQLETWYQDNSGDTTDDLTYTITAKQGTNFILDSGALDIGPNPFGTTPTVAFVLGDVNFGTMGQTGKNNGNCLGNVNYPNPGPGPFRIASNQTCVDPVAGPVTITATTALKTPTFKNGKVTYVTQFKTTQTWTIFLQ